MSACGKSLAYSAARCGGERDVVLASDEQDRCMKNGEGGSNGGRVDGVGRVVPRCGVGEPRLVPAQVGDLATVRVRDLEADGARARGDQH